MFQFLNDQKNNVEPTTWRLPLGDASPGGDRKKNQYNQAAGLHHNRRNRQHKKNSTMNIVKGFPRMNDGISNSSTSSCPSCSSWLKNEKMNPKQKG